MRARSSHFAAALAILIASGSPGVCASLDKLTGSIAGYVRDNSGLPQMGATVSLMNRYERVIGSALTNDRGIFGFDGLPIDVYSIRVSLPSFVPAVKHRIAVQPGMQSLLYINLASVLSSIELVYAAPGQGALMSDDWKWTLKESPATRPVLRALPDDIQTAKREPRQIFSETRGLVSVSGGDGGSLVGDIMQPDLGTAFALATSLFGRNQLQLSGNLGYSVHAGLPTAGFRTTYSREGMGPEVTVTVRQLYMPTRAGGIMATGQQDGVPALRSVSVATIDQMQVADGVLLEYGGSLESISFLDHLNYLSPFARLTWEMGRVGDLQMAYSSGVPPTELLASRSGETAALHQDLAALAVMPRVSLRNSGPALERSQTFEIGYRRKLGSRTLSLSGYRDSVSNAAFLLSNAPAGFALGDLLPDVASDAAVFNTGAYQRYGYSASVTQAFGDKVEVGSSFGRAGALTASGMAANAADLRRDVKMSDKYWASARASATVPGTGTQIAAAYQWTDSNALMPAHFYMTQNTWPQPGLNIEIRQPIPSFAGLPGRLEATAGLENILAQGYLNLAGADGRRLLLTQSPKAVRGGLAFTF
ncbi:MAG TPA: TonB-dependent receptor [Bryobacteraceae bacterium]|nr:TonB-dependent receptor [Bryobacteraceae bacterium]